MEDIQRRFRELFTYSPKKCLISEGYYDKKLSTWICIGEVENYYPWVGVNSDNEKKTYIFVNPEKEMYGGRMRNEVRYAANKDGSGPQMESLPDYYREYIKIYPEHQDDEYGEMFLGKKKDNEILKRNMQKFNSMLFKLNGNIILHHNSSKKITDGLIKQGEKNGYSNNTDVGIYFWGSRNSGRDISGNSTYTYYCAINPNDLYDFETNEERLTFRQALQKYHYVGRYWTKGEAIVVNTFKYTPIWCILDRTNGQWYDKDWNVVEKPF